MNPFPLSSSDAQAFIGDTGAVLQSLPQWGGVIQWRGRYVLAYLKPDYNWALTDITDGIPVNGQMIPAATILANTPRIQTSTLGVFLYSLPGNIYDVARERWQDLQAAAGDVASTVGDVAADLTTPLVSNLMPVLVLGVAAFLIFEFSRAK